jgi:hypothetical protein
VVTRQILARIINELESPFDTHDVEKRALRNHTEAFVTELLDYCGRTGDPLKAFSAAFGQRIDRQFRRQIRKTLRNKVRSPNLAGDKVSNQQWERRNARVPIT